MKKSSKYLILTVIVAISVIVVTVPFWNFTHNKRIGFFNEGYTKLPVVTKIGKFPSLVIADEASAMSIIEPTEIVLKNRNGFSELNNLYLLVEKRSTIPNNYIRVSLDDTIYKINEIEIEEDNDNYYFYLKSIETDAYEEVSLNARIWLSEETNNVASDSTLVTNFIVR